MTGRVSGRVCASTLWDPDGSGPRLPVLVLGGSFDTAGGVPCEKIATYDLEFGVWSALGSGMNHDVWALATAPNGDLVAGGQFTGAGGVAANYVARWNGTSWSGLGTGMNSIVFALTTHAGQLVAGGRFTTAGGAAASHIAIWNGTSWSALGAGPGPNGDILALTTNLTTNGSNLVAGGSFTMAGGVSAANIAMWDGSAWAPLGLGVGGGVGAFVGALTTANGVVVAGGGFTTAGGVTAHRVAQWSNATATWSPMGQGFSHSQSVVNALTTLPGGIVVAGGVLATAARWDHVTSWNGTAWTGLNLSIESNGYVRTITAVGGDVVAGGVFVGFLLNNVARCNASTAARPLLDMSGLQGSVGTAGVKALTTLPSGTTVAGGGFTRAGTLPLARIAQRSGTGWLPMGLGMNGAVAALTGLQNGDVVAGGYFTEAVGVANTAHIARWNGSAWSSLGGGMNNSVFALVRLANGSLVAGGDFTSAGGVPANRIASWNGGWSALGAGMNGSVLALAEASNGDVIVGGSFTTAGGNSISRIARYRLGAWGSLLAGLNGDVRALTALTGGRVIAAGSFTAAGSVSVSRVALWDGIAWSPLGSGLNGDAHALRTLPNGDVVVAGSFTSAGGVPANGIARWDGTNWSAFGAGVNGAASALLWLADGHLEVGGDFATAGGLPNSYVARLTTTCRAELATHGAGCAGSGGVSTYASDSLPWAGSVFRARGTQLPAQALVAVVSGFSTDVTPLAWLLPPSPPNCYLFVSPALVELTNASAGMVDTSLFIPNLANLAGLSLHRQLVLLEPQVRSTSSNALSLTVGFF